VLKGTLDDFSLPDIFRLAALANKTGRLEVERRNGSGRVYFRDGEVYYAESTKSKERLGRKLTRSGWVTDEQLRRAMVEHEQTGRRVGEILVGQGAVEEEQIEWAVRSQIEDGVFDLLRWDLGAFVWEPDVEIEVEVPLTVTVENLIIEASRRLDEISQIRKKIPSADVVLAMAARPPDGAHQINITSEEWQVLVLVDGRRTVEDIATSTGAEAYQTTRLLFGLMNAGLIEHKHVPIEGSDESDRPSSRSLQDRQRGAGSAGPQGGDRWHKSADPDSNVVELQRGSDDDDVDVDFETQGDEERPAVTTPPAPPPAPESYPEDEDSFVADRGPEQGRAPSPPHPRRSDDEGEDEVSQREPVPPPSPRRSGGPRVDRAAVVRELAGLFNEENKPRPRAVPSGDRNESERPEPTQKRRVEDDDQVDRKLIGRMIDGVKEL
jgi:hypothetical protein